MLKKRTKEEKEYWRNEKIKKKKKWISDTLHNCFREKKVGERRKESGRNTRHWESERKRKKREKRKWENYPIILFSPQNFFLLYLFAAVELTFFIPLPVILKVAPGCVPGLIFITTVPSSVRTSAVDPRSAW